MVISVSEFVIFVVRADIHSGSSRFSQLVCQASFPFMWFNLKQISNVLFLFCKITFSHLVIQFNLNSIKTAIRQWSFARPPIRIATILD